MSCCVDEDECRANQARIKELECALIEIRDSPYCRNARAAVTDYWIGFADGNRYCAQIAQRVIPKEPDE